MYNLIHQSDDVDVRGVGVEIFDRMYTFGVSFESYDALTKESDLPLEKKWNTYD